MTIHDLDLFIDGSVNRVQVTEVNSISVPPRDGEPLQVNRVYTVYKDINSDSHYFGLYNQYVHSSILDHKECIYNASQTIPGIVNIYLIKSDRIITECLKRYYPVIITPSCNFYSPETYINHSQNHYKKFKMENTEYVLGIHNLQHLEVDPDYKNNRCLFHGKVVQAYKSFYEQTGCIFTDIAPNNILVNESFDDFKIIDVFSIKYVKGDNIDSYYLDPPINSIIGPSYDHVYLHSI